MLEGLFLLLKESLESHFSFIYGNGTPGQKQIFLTYINLINQFSRTGKYGSNPGCSLTSKGSNKIFKMSHQSWVPCDIRSFQKNRRYSRGTLPKIPLTKERDPGEGKLPPVLTVSFHLSL